MTVANGLYRVEFSTPAGPGTGVVYLSNGSLNGGDSMMAYSGSYEEGSDGVFKATAHIFKHSDVANFVSAIGTDDGTLQASGTATANTVAMSAPVPGTPLSMQIALTKIA